MGTDERAGRPVVIVTGSSRGPVRIAALRGVTGLVFVLDGRIR